MTSLTERLARAAVLPRITRYLIAGVFVFEALFIIGCHGGHGRVQVTRGDVVGVYEAKFDTGREVLELRNDQTYIQDFTAEKKSIHHTGTWRIENHFLSESDVVLISCVVGENENISALERIGDRILNVHMHSGKVTLAINEAADWYFVRIQ